MRATDPSDYNSPSIAIGTLLKRQTVTRRATAVEPGLYTAKVQGVRGVKVSVSPSILSFNAKGETKSFKVTFDNRSADFDEATSGFLTWRAPATRCGFRWWSPRRWSMRRRRLPARRLRSDLVHDHAGRLR